MADENYGIVSVRDQMEGESKDMFCSLSAGTQKEKALVFNAMNNPQHRVGDYVNKQIVVRDVFVEMVTIEDEDTHEIAEVPRTVLIDMKGEAYQAVSNGIFRALKNAIAVFGAPTWEDGLPITVKQVSIGKNQMLTFTVDAK